MIHGRSTDFRRKTFAIASALLVVAALCAGCARKSVDDYVAAGDQARRDNNLAEAEKSYQAAVRLAPDDPRGHVGLGDLYMFQNKPADAQLEFMKVIELQPANPAAHAALGRLYADQSQLSLAEEQYRAAVALDPARSNYHLDLAGVLRSEGKLDEAEREMRTAIGLDPKNAQAHFALANLLNSEPSRQSDAQVEYASARALDPKLVPPQAAPTPAAVTAAAAPAVKIKPVDRKFLVAHDSPMYENPDEHSRVVGKVRARGYVHVTGITGNWLQVKLRHGTIGFIPDKAVE